MNADANSEQTRLRCITTILDLDDEALQIVATLLTRVADTEKSTHRRPRAKNTAPPRRTTTSAIPPAEVTR